MSGRAGEAARGSVRAANDSVMSRGWSIPVCQVGMSLRLSATVWSCASSIVPFEPRIASGLFCAIASAIAMTPASIAA